MSLHSVRRKGWGQGPSYAFTKNSLLFYEGVSKSTFSEFTLLLGREGGTKRVPSVRSS